jgi:hypothetical protein
MVMSVEYGDSKNYPEPGIKKKKKGGSGSVSAP